MNIQATKRGWAGSVADTLYNLMSGLGVSTHDKSVFQAHTIRELTRLDFEVMYRGDWIARKVVRIPADDATRAWRGWQAEDDQIEAIEEVELYHKIQQKVRKAKTLERLYGGAAMILGVQGSGSATSELKIERLKRDCLKFVHVVSRHELVAGGDGMLEEDLESPYFGQPKMYARQIRGGDQVEIHPSRVIRFAGEDYPDPAMSPDGWGESVLQGVYDAVSAAGLVTQGVASLLHELKTDIIGIKELSGQLSTTESTNLLRRRFEIVNLMKSNNRLMLTDKEDTWQRQQISFASLPELMQSYLAVAAAAADIPATRMLSKSPDGMNATGKSDTQNYDDKVSSEQQNEITPTISPLDEILIISATGGRDPSIYYEWRPLRQMTDMEKADVAIKKAQVAAADVASMLIPTDALTKARQNQLIEDGTYPGLEAALEDSDGEVVNPELERQLEHEAEQQEVGHEQGLESQEVGHKQQLEVLKKKPKKAFGKDEHVDVSDYNKRHVRKGEHGGEFATAKGQPGEGGKTNESENRETDARELQEQIRASENSLKSVDKILGGKQKLSAAQREALRKRKQKLAAELQELEEEVRVRSKGKKKFYKTKDEAIAAAGPGQRVIRVRMSAADAEKLLRG